MNTAKKSRKTSVENYEFESSTLKGYDPYKQSNLFHEVYLNVEVPVKFKKIWDIGEEGEFGKFCNSFRNLCENYDQKNFDTWNEQDTIHNWITPIIKMLGYNDKCKEMENPFSLDTAFTYEGRTLKPDYIIVDRPSDLKYIKSAKTSDQKLEQAKDYVKLTVEAKYWNRLEEYRQNNSEIKTKANNAKKDDFEGIDPADQILNYMKMLNNDWGILTDGKVWRLYHKDLSSDSQKRCFQFNLGYLIKYAKNSIDISSEEYKIFIENIKYFYFLFNKEALIGISGKERIVDSLIEYSKEYVHRIEDDLKKRFVAAMTTLCNGIHEALGSPSDQSKLSLIRNIAESHLFNMMFIKSCESRLVLPMKDGNYSTRSLTRMVQSLKSYKPERAFDEHNLECLSRSYKNLNGDEKFEFKWEGLELYQNLINLTEFVQNGSNPNFTNFKIDGFTETVFSKDEWNIAKKLKIKNKWIISVLFEIGFAKSDILGKKFQQIPYNFITARQLGSIYESFLEYKIEVADCDMAYISNEWQKTNLKNDKYCRSDISTVKKNELYFTPTSKEKKDSGTFYTPDNLVQLTVHQVVSKYLDSKNPEKTFNIKLCDPAMGSGHFLCASLEYLTKYYLISQSLRSDEFINYSKAKREILHNCIFGVDINPRAVKLTKMSLWLESAVAGEKLYNLDNNLKVHDSLLLLDPPFKNINIIVGNPPWVLKTHQELGVDTVSFLNNHYLSMSGFKKNLFPLFVELSCKWSSHSPASVGLIVPNRLMDTPSYKDTRKALFDLGYKVEIIKLPEGSFADVTASYVLLHINAKNRTDTKIDVLEFENKSVKKIFSIDHSDIGTDFKVNLNHDPAFSSENKSLLKESYQLVDYFHCHVGMMVKNNKETFLPRSSGKSKTKIVKGKCLGKVYLKNHYYFDPLSAEIFGGTKRPIKHEFAPKLLVRKTGNELISCIDLNKKSPTYAEQSVYLVIPKAQMAIEVIQAVNIYLNTSLPTQYFRSELITNPDSYPYLQQYDLEQIPVPKIIFEKNQVQLKILSLFEEYKDTDIERALKNVDTYIRNRIFGEVETEEKIAA